MPRSLGHRRIERFTKGLAFKCHFDRREMQVLASIANGRPTLQACFGLEKRFAEMREVDFVLDQSQDSASRKDAPRRAEFDIAEPFYTQPGEGTKQNDDQASHMVGKRTLK